VEGRQAVTINIPQMLPPKAREKWSRIVGTVADAEASLNALTGRVKNAEHEVMIAQAGIRAGNPRDLAAYQRLERNLEAAGATLASVESERGLRQERLWSAQASLSPVQIWFQKFNSGPIAMGPVFVDVAVDPGLRPGEPIEVALDRVRNDVAEARGALMRLRAAPLPADEIKRQIAALVDGKATRGAPRLDINGSRVSIGWSDVADYVQFAPTGSVSDQLCWLFRDDYVRMLTANVDEQVGDRGIALADRPPREMALMRDLLALERIEEALVEIAVEAGRPVRRRSDADVMAVLQIAWPPMPEEKPAGPPGDPPVLAAAE
jgi:hypothetical protein